MSNSNVVRGTMMLTGANYISKILGMLYVIPFYQLVGDTGMALYSYAYNPYQVFISIATLGIPLAMSKFVAKYHTLEDYQTKNAMFRSGLILMTITGIVSFLIMFFGAELLANIFISSDKLANSVGDATFVIKMVSFSLLIIPVMSLLRGYFQGHDDMGPSAISIVLEQIVRIVFLLAAAFVVIHILNKTVTLAVGLAAFAAFIGAIASSFVLGGFYNKRRPIIKRELEHSKNESPSLKKSAMYRELLAYAGPFVLVGIATPLYQIIDQATFNTAMVKIGLANISEQLLNVIIVTGHKIVIIPVTLATGLALALLPSMTRAFTENNKVQYNSYILQSLLIIMLLILPASVGLSLLSEQAYGTLYDPLDSYQYAGKMLAYYAPTALFFALFTVSASMLQGVDKQNFAVVSLLVGLLIKLTCNVPFIYVFEAKGAVFATGLAVLSASMMNLFKLYRETHFDIRRLFKRSLLIIILTTIMGLVVWFMNWLVGLPFGAEISRLKYIAQLFVSVSVGGYIYLWMAYKTTLLERLLGSRINRFSKFFF
ncbi:putative polysaccharide biosynthesis protein [Bacillaceae bacterium W0354]